MEAVDMEQVRITDMAARDLTPMQDVWHRPLRPAEMLAYKRLGETGVISRIHATASRSTGITIMSYAAIGPQAWIHEALHQAAEEIEHEEVS